MKVAIAGYGAEGRASFEYWKALGHEVVVADERSEIDTPEDAKTILGKGAFSKLNGFDIVVRTAGLAPQKITTDGKIWSATNEFFAKCPAPIIGITGTKGKGTTASLITSILKAAGKTAHLVGNIGVPALEVLPTIKKTDIVVYELSSFQLWDLEKSPHVAVVLPIEPDHLDVHPSMDDYVKAKTNIVLYQQATDFVIFNKNNQLSHGIASRSMAQKIEYPFAIDEFKASLQIPGVHNQENASAAIAVARIFDCKDDDIKKGLADFSGLPHRLKFVAKKRGVEYYDDSIATTPGSAVAAVRSFADKPIVLLMGGQDKGGDYSELAQECRARDVKVVAYGANRELLKQRLAGVDLVLCDGGMEQVVGLAAKMLSSGVVVLSPAASSFDMFKSYMDRGEQFVAAVRGLDD